MTATLDTAPLAPLGQQKRPRRQDRHTKGMKAGHFRDDDPCTWDRGMLTDMNGLAELLNGSASGRRGPRRVSSRRLADFATAIIAAHGDPTDVEDDPWDDDRSLHEINYDDYRLELKHTALMAGPYQPTVLELMGLSREHGFHRTPRVDPGDDPTDCRDYVGIHIRRAS